MEGSAQPETSAVFGDNTPKGTKFVDNFKSKCGNLFLGLKCVNCGVLVIAFGIHLHNLFTATWATDHGLDTPTGHQGRVHHQLFGFTQDGDQDAYPLHREGYWQDWKKPLIKQEIVGLSLGFTAMFVQGIIIFLHFLHPRRAEAVALLTSVVLLSCGGGGLLIKTSMDYTNNRPVLGFKETSIPTNFVSDITEETGGKEAVVGGAVYLTAGAIDVILILITLYKLPNNAVTTQSSEKLN
ncbi:uncharacterized protein LOC110456262 [Mizuhopecten yessoensis]|uniref:Uncharacterized protein n=1 Tax=Mizuhopecten yessoensis TaxID=6573 RepID=A0A210QBB9_MIZYE|nr:uncharacterized protein LOC110456262 [Mizuhopecten yessoensis]OWF46037.1 hypothetical protein KP79_PYT01476 [Mizuhopecten yessoensis]